MKIYLLVSGGIFLLVAIAHVARLTLGWEIHVGPFTLPLWVSWIGMAVTLSLALWALKLVKKR